MWRTFRATIFGKKGKGELDMNCWEFNACGREAGGARAQELGVCPAYPDHGKDCAQIAGTFCGGKVQGLLAAKLQSCMSCPFYNSEHHHKDMKSLLRIVTVVDQTAEAIVVTDADGTIVYVNPAFSTITGYSQTEVLGKNPRILKSGRHDAGFYRDLWQSLRENGVWKGRIADRRKDGSVVEIESTITPINDHHGVVSNYVAINRDVTELVELENKLRQAQQLQAIGSLAAGIAHEINTPIQFVRDNLNFLAESFREFIDALEIAKSASKLIPISSTDPDELAKFVSSVNSEEIAYLEKEVPVAIIQTLEGIERVARIVRAMRDFTHPGDNDRKLTDINRAIENTVLIANSEVKHVADVILNLDHSLPPVSCFPGALNQALLNLIVNAAHAIAEVNEKGGEAKGVITITTEKLANDVLISVSDTGSGIDSDIRDRIFDPFFTTKPVGDGTGQGLAITHSIVAKHGGSLSVESEKGNGATFRIRIPMATSSQTPGLREVAVSQ